MFIRFSYSDTYRFENVMVLILTLVQQTGNQFLTQNRVISLSMTQTSRQRWMQLLAEAEVQELQSAFERLEKPVPSSFLIKPETGMVMVQGKADGTGTPF